MGSGMATIRDPNPIKLGEFHTVELHRNLTLGSLRVDGGEAINGSSQVRLPVSLPWLHSRFKMVYCQMHNNYSSSHWQCNS